MTFSEQLNNYITQFECTSSDLATASGLSSTVISRYRNDERTPNIKSKQFEDLVDGLYIISNNKKIKISKEAIYNSLASTLSEIAINFEQLSKNFNELVKTLNINIADLARFINYDASFISKIRNGSRSPSKPKNFIQGVCNYIVTKYKSENDKKAISVLINCNLNDLEDKSNFYLNLEKWLSTNLTPSHNYINDFLNNLDTFDLGKYIKAIHFDEMKVPFIPFYKPSSKTYYGIEEMKKGELDFFKATVLSKSNESVFMCSDMPMEDMAEDVEFGKKWMFAIAMMLKKCLHLNIIHNLDRPFNEMMLGLESWIPIYMTGQVSPYFFKGNPNSVYCHFNYVSENVALTGECVNGYHDKGKYTLITSKTDVAYYKKKAECLLNKATPLMVIYKKDTKNAYNAFISSSAKIKANRRRILSSLPIHTITDELLLKILKYNNISNTDIENIKASVKEQKQIMKTILADNIFEDEIQEISKEEFNNTSPTLCLSDSFYENKVSYTYETYIEHLKLTKQYEKNNKNYKLTTNNTHIFKNIQVLICEKNWVMISKSNSPSIHFIIHHPKLRNAIENFIPPIIE